MDKKVHGNKVGVLFCWIFGIILLLFSLSSFVSASLFSGFISLIVSLIIIPPINKIIQEKTKIRFSAGIKIVLTIVAIIFALASLGANSSNSNGNFTLKTDRVPFENALLGSIYKNKIVFYTDINSENSNRDIYLYDIDNNKLSQITKDNSNQEQPYIYEDIIVWTDYRFKQVSVFMYNISTGEETKLNISVQKIGFSSIIGIYDGIICGRSYHDGVYLFFYNISSNNIEEIPVPDYYRQFYYKNKIALLTKDNKIYIYDKTTNVTIQLNNTYEKKGISIYENSVVWSDNRNGRLNFDLYYYNLQNGSEYQITNFQDTEEIEPFIFKNNIAYSRFKNSHNDDSYKSIYLYDLNTGISKKLSGEMASQPQIFENIIVWREGTPSFMKSRDIIIIRQI